MPETRAGGGGARGGRSINVRADFAMQLIVGS